MYIYKYISNLQTQFKGNILYIYRIAVSLRDSLLKFTAFPPPHPLHKLNTQLKPSGYPHINTHTHARTHAHTLTPTHTVSPVGILLYVIIGGGCTIKQAGVQWLALLAPSEHAWQGSQSHLLLLLLTLLVLQVLHGLHQTEDTQVSPLTRPRSSSSLTFWGELCLFVGCKVWWGWCVSRVCLVKTKLGSLASKTKSADLHL